MAIISANLQFNRGGHGLLDYSSLQTNYSTALAWAKDVNSNAAVGQFIYLENAETIGDVEYAKGPYVVDAIGENAVLTPLSKSVAGEQDLSGAIADLKSGLATTNSSVNSLETKVNALPTTFVTDVKDASGESVVIDGVVTLGDYATKAELEEAIGNVDFSALVTKTEFNEGLANKVDSSVVYTKEETDAKYVVQEGYVEYTQVEKDKLASIAEGAEVNYIKSVGDNLNVDASGKLTVIIPEVEVPIQSIVEGDKVLKLEGGVLSSGLSYDREEVDGIDSLVLKGIDGVIIGSVPVAEFIADGMLESVEPKVDNPNIFVFTFNSAAGEKSFEVDFSKYVDTYNADGETIELGDNNTFKVKEGVFEVAGAAAIVKGELDEYKESNNAVVADKLDASVYNEKMTQLDTSVSELKTSLMEYAKSSDVSAALNGKVDVIEGSRLMTNEEGVKLAALANIKSVEGNLTLSEIGALSVDLSGYVQKDGDKVLSTEDFTTELKSKLEGIEEGAEVNYIKSVGDNLNVTEGNLTVDLSAYALIADVNNSLALKSNKTDVEASLLTKLDASAKVNGVSFVDGVATLDAGDITLESAINRGEEETFEEVYSASSSIQSVLASLSARIDVLDPNISGEFGVSSITAGNGIEVSGAQSTPTIAVKESAFEGNVAEVKTDGIYVPDMRSYWENI